MNTKVTVIAIAYNHAPFIQEALESVEAQAYPNLELILLDDGSSDESADVLSIMAAKLDVAKLIVHEKNEGYTRTFNQGLALATGDYVIDFALDDVMLPGFISKSVAALEAAGAYYGVCFSNADFIDAHSKLTGNHYEQLMKKGMIEQMPRGDVFEMVLKRYFICTPTMVIRRQVFDRIGGYDADLAFEDFDFWVRSSRYYKYCYVDEVLLQKRKLDNSMSANRLIHWQNEQLNSVYEVCEKAFALCKSKAEIEALRQRLSYEYRQCIRTDHSVLATKYLLLLKQTGAGTWLTQFWGWLIALGFDPKRVK